MSSVARQVHGRKVSVIEANVHALHIEQEHLLRVCQVRCAENDWSAEELHVRVTLVTTEAPVTIRAKYISARHLHGPQSLSDELRHVLVREDCLNASTASRESRRARQRFWREVTHLVCPLHATILQEAECRLVPFDKPEQGREKVQCDPVASAPIHFWLPLDTVHMVWLLVTLDVILHLLPDAHERCFLFVTEGYL